MGPERQRHPEFNRTKGWLTEKRRKKRKEQERSNNFFWRNDPERQVTIYRAEPGKPVPTSLRDRLHQLLLTVQSSWTPTDKGEARRLVLEEGFSNVSHKQVYTNLQARQKGGENIPIKERPEDYRETGQHNYSGDACWVDISTLQPPSYFSKEFLTGLRETGTVSVEETGLPTQQTVFEDPLGGELPTSKEPFTS